MSFIDRAVRLVVGWAVLSPFWLLTVAALVWGRVSLSREEVKRALAQTLATSVWLVFPAAWAILTYCAGFDPQPTTSPVVAGGFLAALLLPVYSALVAWAAFEFAVQAAQRRGALRRPLALRVLASLFVTAVVILAFGLLGAACLLVAGKAMG